MGKLLALASCCCILLAVTQRILAEQEKKSESESRNTNSEETNELKEFYIKKLYARVLARRALIVGDSVKIESVPEPAILPVPEVALLHNQLQNKLGWGGDSGGNSNNNQNSYGPPGGFQQQFNNGPSQQYQPPPQAPNQNYGPPPQPQSNHQYGPPPQPNQQYGPGPAPQPNQQYGPPPQPSQQYGPGPAPQPNQQYGPPNQQYGPPPPSQQYGPGPSPNQNYGPPPQQQQPPSQSYNSPSQEYGPPQQPSQSYGPPNQEYGPPQSNQLRVNQGNFGGHIENFKISEAVRSNDGNNNNNGYKDSPSPQYGPPSFNNNKNNFKNSGGSDRTPKIFKHVYIHTPPPENDVPEKRVIKPNNAKQDTHYQIIFVKAPSPPQVQTEIEIPPAPERKTLVYVLVKRPEKSEIKFRTAPPTQPPKPEVYFIRYKNKQNQNGGNQGGYSNGNDNDIQSFPDDLQVPAPLLGGNDLGNDGYQNEIDSLGGVFGNGMAELVRNALSNGRDTATGSYPNTEYRAQPNMLGPNQEPMSIAVYDKVRNSVTPNPRRSDSLLTSSSNVNAIISQLQKSNRQQRQQQGSHYTAPGSQPFTKPSGRMVNGHYVGMTSNILRSKYYTPAEDEQDGI